MRVVLLSLCVLLAGCKFTGGRWVVEEEVPRCPGGRIEQEKRITDVVAGRTRNTTIRTNTCLD